MPADGRPYRRSHATFRARCEEQQAPCWFCMGKRGPIDYSRPHNPKNPLAFTVDHLRPTSRGGNPTDIANFRACHAVCNSSRGNNERRAFPTSRRW
jgi:hypothetical protein